MQETEHNTYMQRCLELAAAGSGFTTPNPLVGSVIVYQDKIIGEGFHQRYGEAHAEVNAINSVEDPSLLPQSTLYVNLEPCAHHGLTPPCSDLIIGTGIPKVVLGARDPFDAVDGKGIERMKKAGIEVISNVLEKECQHINRRFFTFHEKKRPFIVLKWAQTTDGYLDKVRSVGDGQSALSITGMPANRLVHKWRSEEAGILVGSGTALLDNPFLNVRNYSGPNPLRILLDRGKRVPSDNNIFKGDQKTLVFGQAPEEDNLNDLMTILHEKDILSVMVEGGAQILNQFISEGIWDETRILVGPETLGKGIAAPVMPGTFDEASQIGEDRLLVFRK